DVKEPVKIAPDRLRSSRSRGLRGALTARPRGDWSPGRRYARRGGGLVLGCGLFLLAAAKRAAEHNHETSQYHRSKEPLHRSRPFDVVEFVYLAASFDYQLRKLVTFSP